MLLPSLVVRGGIKLDDLTVEISFRVHPTFGAVAKELAGPNAPHAQDPKRRGFRPDLCTR